MMYNNPARGPMIARPGMGAPQPGVGGFNGQPAPFRPNPIGGGGQVPILPGRQPIATPDPARFGQFPIQGSFDNLKGTKKIKKGGLYKLKAGEKVTGVMQMGDMMKGKS